MLSLNLLLFKGEMMLFKKRWLMHNRSNGCDLSKAASIQSLGYLQRHPGEPCRAAQFDMPSYLGDWSRRITSAQGCGWLDKAWLHLKRMKKKLRMKLSRSIWQPQFQDDCVGLCWKWSGSLQILHVCLDAHKYLFTELWHFGQVTQILQT